MYRDVATHKQHSDWSPPFALSYGESRLVGKTQACGSSLPPLGDKVSMNNMD